MKPLEEAKKFLKRLEIEDKIFITTGTDGKEDVFHLSDVLCDFKLSTAQERERELIALLKIAKCPCCDGSGGIIVESGVSTDCCGHFNNDGTCCNNPIPSQNFDLEPCQWCDERNKLIQQLKNQ